MRDSTGRERTNRPLARTHVAHRLAPALPGYRWRWAAGGSLRLSPSAPSAGLKAQSHPPSAAPVPPRLPMPTSPRADDTPSRTHAAHRLAPALPGYRWRWAAGGSLRLSPSAPSAGLKAQSHPPSAAPVPPRLPMPTSPRADDTPSRTHAAHRLAPALPGYRWRWAAGGSLRLSPSAPSSGLKAQSHPPCAAPVPPRLTMPTSPRADDTPSRTHAAHRLAPALPGYRWRWAAGGSLRLTPRAPSAGLKAQSHPPSAAPVPPRLPMPTSPRADDTPSRTHAAHRLAPALPGYRWRWAAGGSLRLSPSAPSAGLKAQSHP